MQTSQIFHWGNLEEVFTGYLLLVVTTEKMESFSDPSKKSTTINNPSFTKADLAPREFNIVNGTKLKYMPEKPLARYANSDHFHPLTNNGKKYNIITGQESEVVIYLLF